jgi:uncharacterized protein YktA (UPF0223 family)
VANHFFLGKSANVLTFCYVFDKSNENAKGISSFLKKPIKNAYTRAVDLQKLMGFYRFFGEILECI